ncbi:MAG TPA: DNA-binding response regulator [Lachnospiraceae bacterium]|nr:DNA-binding response regulator [Lachnospiraceae bacterium]
MPYKILIVEDDENIAKYIHTCLSVGGYESEICMDGQSAVELAADRCYDLILLDVMLPGLDGFEVMEKIRGYGIPVIYLTAMQDVTNKVRGLKSGAEDYIVKPFETLELLARIELVMKRHRKTDAVLHYGRIRLDTEKHTVQMDDRPVSLTPKEFDVLAFFIRHRDVVISREQLLAAIWGYQFEGETRTVDTHVQQVRKKLDLQGLLVTVPKYGYRLLKTEG